MYEMHAYILQRHTMLQRKYSPEQSWYSGSCLTVDTWRLSGSRQLQKAPEISNKKDELVTEYMTMKRN